jgi:hypothetical protein
VRGQQKRIVFPQAMLRIVAVKCRFVPMDGVRLPRSQQNDCVSSDGDACGALDFGTATMMVHCTQ